MPVFMFMRLTALPVSAIALWAAFALAARAQAGDLLEGMREDGVSVSGSLTHFHQSVVAGDGDGGWRSGGKGDFYISLDGGRIGLWPGLVVNLHHELLYGDDANDRGDGSLLALNSALAFPDVGGYRQDTSMNATQNFGETFSLGLGKFNMLDAAARTPLVGGGGLDTFMHNAFAAPISGVTPAYLLGAIATAKSKPAIATLMVYDPRNAQDNEVLRDPFVDGFTTSLSLTFPVAPGGLPGFYGVRGVYSTKEGLDFRAIPDLFLPPEAKALVEADLTRKGYWFASASMQQYLWQSPGNPAAGWGVFAEAAISDGNPNPVRWHASAGLAGNSALPGREADRWGIGYFRYSFSRDLTASLATLGIDIRDEQGVEVFYNLAIHRNLRLTGDIQWIDTGRGDLGDATVLALRLQARF